MLEPDRLAYCFSLTHELPDVEFKGPGKGRDNPLFGRVVRAAMVMANRRGGGIVIIGVSETATGLSFDGLTPEEIATWKYESIAGGFNSYTNLPIEFDRLEYEHDGNTFLVLDIHEFATVPVMCIKEYRDRSNPKMPEDQCPIVLRAGSFYVRTLNKPESKEMLTSEEIRTLFELAIDKGIQSFVTRTKLAGINIAPLPEDRELFAQQLQGWNGPILEEIRSRGYWDIHIRPVTFERDRLPLSELYPLLIRASLNYRGGEFPYITAQMPQIGNDWIGLEHQKEFNLQAWRFFQSGQFAAEVGFLDDWEDKLAFPVHETWTIGVRLSVLDVVFRLTEIYGLASRLATTDLYRDERSLVVETTLRNVEGRTLYDRGAWNLRSPVSSRPTAAENISYPETTQAKEDIIGKPRELALEAAQYVFQRFGWNPSTQLLATIQSELNIHS
jgi:hypothetical protein